MLQTEQVNEFVEHVKVRVRINDLLAIAPFVSEVTDANYRATDEGWERG